MALAQEKTYTIDDICALPDGERAELIGGRIYYMAPPNTKHQRLVNRLSQRITNYIDSNRGNCEVLPAPFAVFLNADEKTYVEPDISVIYLNRYGKPPRRQTRTVLDFHFSIDSVLPASA